MRNTYILVDFENVQPAAFGALEQNHVNVLVFVGASQAKVPFDLAVAMQRMGARAEYIRIDGNGRNALDFHIAFYLGKLAAADPAACFFVISKDTGFDPLLQHLKDKKISVVRAKAITEISLGKAVEAKTPEECLETVIVRLKQLKSAKPRTLKALTSTIMALFGKRLSEDEVCGLVQLLQTRGMVSADGNKINYAMESEA